MAETGYTTVSTLETPTDVALASITANSGDSLAYSNWSSYTIVKTVAETHQAYISFKCKHYTFQVIWMYRRRKSPTLLESEGKDRAREEWTDWSEIQGSATETASTERRAIENTAYHTTTEPISFGVDLDHYTDAYKDYDAWEFAMGVRTVDEEPRQVSAWSTDLYECKQKGTDPQNTIKVVYKPYVEWGPFVRKNGSLYLNFKAYWERDNNIIKFSRTVNYKQMTDTWKNISHGDTQTTALASKMYTDLTDAATEMPTFKTDFFSFETTDDILFHNYATNGASIAITNEAEESKEVQTPTVQVDYYEDFALLRIMVLDANNLTNISTTLSFTNSAGNTVTSGYLDGSSWETYNEQKESLKVITWYEEPIFDVPMTLTVALSNGSKFSVGQFLVNVHSYGMVWSTGNNGEFSELVQAPYNIGLDEDLDFDTDSIKTALGTRPVMRYGTGGERTIKASCATVRQSTVASRQTVSTPTAKVTVYDCQTKETTVRDAEKYTPWNESVSVKPDTNTTANRIVERLKQPHDWVFRAPHGVWYNVAVTAVNRSWDYSTQLDTVDVTMQEVDDDS